MKNELFEHTRMLSYLLWEYTKCENALGLWYCAEDLSNYFEQRRLMTVDALEELLNREKEDYYYIEFVRNIAYRLYMYTGVPDKAYNWFMAEHILNNGEFRLCVTNAAAAFSKLRTEKELLKSIRSDTVRAYYKNLE